jgi:hypothetical protein
MKSESIALMSAILWIAQSASGQSTASEKTAGEAFKNVQVLQDVPVSDWNNTMDFMAGALGVGCLHCHAIPYEKDDLKPKRTARLMIKMTREINAANFGGRAFVTCATCHQGSLHPSALPSLSAIRPAAGPATVPDASNAQSLPDVDQVMANYRKAVGPDVRSFRMKGTISVANRAAIPTDLEMIVPDRLSFHATVGGTEVVQVLNGDRGWTVANGATRDMEAENLMTRKVMIETLRPVKFFEAPAPRKVTGTEKIGGRTYTVVESRVPKRLERLYFDAQSGLLFRRYVEVQTPLGVSPGELTFEDYRDENGVKLPHLIVNHTMADQTEYKFSEVQLNVAIDPSRFEKKKD